MVKQHTIPITLFLDDDLGLAFSDLADHLSDLAHLLDRSSKDTGVHWQIESVSMNSPMTLEARPVAESTVNLMPVIATSAMKIAEGFARAKNAELADLQSDTDDENRASRMIIARLKGSSIVGTTFNFQKFESTLESIQIGETYDVVGNGVISLLNPVQTYFGAVEGYVSRINAKKKIMWISVREDASTVKCDIRNINNQASLLENTLRDVLVDQLLRVEVHGLIHQTQDGTISSIEVEDVVRLPDGDPIPDLSVLLREGFTGGVDAVTYVRTLRDVEPE